jgi:hypothetical protein
MISSASATRPNSSRRLIFKLIIINLFVSFLLLCNSVQCLNTPSSSSSSTQPLLAGKTKLSKKEAILNELRQSNHKLIALAGQSVTLTCSIDLSDEAKNFSKIVKDHSVIWSKETENGKDYEPLALDDMHLMNDPRLDPHRIVFNKQDNNIIEWSLVINNLRLTDASYYICQLNHKPYDMYWLKRFMLDVYGESFFFQLCKG